MDLLKCKMCEKDKKRIARSKAWGKKAMVIRTINKTNGKPNVHPGMHCFISYILVLALQNNTMVPYHTQKAVSCIEHV